jgi:hypothetical protein
MGILTDIGQMVKRCGNIERWPAAAGRYLAPGGAGQG